MARGVAWSCGVARFAQRIAPSERPSGQMARGVAWGSRGFRFLQCALGWCRRVVLVPRATRLTVNPRRHHEHNRSFHHNLFAHLYQSCHLQLRIQGTPSSALAAARARASPRQGPVVFERRAERTDRFGKKSCGIKRNRGPHANAMDEIRRLVDSCGIKRNRGACASS
jgi:hypothetical protein